MMDTLPVGRRLLVVDDEPALLRYTRLQLESRGFTVSTAASGTEAIRLATSEVFDGIVLDHQLGDTDSLAVLDALQARDRGITVVILSGTIDVLETVRAIRAGAEDVQIKPANLDHLVAALERGLARTALARSRALMATQVLDPYGVLDDSPAMQRVRQLVQASATNDLPLLFRGEPGTGKRALAEMAHQLSPRAGDPLVCVTIPDGPEAAQLRALQSALAHFPVHNGRPQLRGTLLLADVATLAPAVQSALLGLVDARQAERQGQPPSDLRVITTTSVTDLHPFGTGAGSASLWQRLSTIPIAVPALAERGPQAIMALATRHLQRLRLDGGDGPSRFTAPAAEWLGSLPWPGNVPQLRHVVDEAFLRAWSDAQVDVPHLEPVLLEAGLHANSDRQEADWSLRTLERRHIRTVLAMTGDNRTRAAKLLGITRATLYNKLAEDE
jgi:DNA-binding NtrC family response regulator